MKLYREQLVELDDAVKVRNGISFIVTPSKAFWFLKLGRLLLVNVRMLGRRGRVWRLMLADMAIVRGRS